MSQSSMVVARLYEHIGPIDRGTRYEDPLDAALRAASLGEVTGGGSQLGALGEIECADVEIQVVNLDDAMPVIVDVLQRSGAPAGSQLLGGGGVIREFGEQQSVAVYLDGTTLPDDVYANLDFDDLVARLTEAAGPDSFHGYWAGPEETGLFFSEETPRRPSRHSRPRCARCPSDRMHESSSAPRAIVCTIGPCACRATNGPEPANT